MIKGKFLPYIFFVFCFTLSAQDNLSVEANFRAIYSKSQSKPFWFYSQQRGRVDDSTNFAGWVSLGYNFNTGANSSFEVAGGFLYRDKALYEDLVLDELYAEFGNSWILAFIGLRHYDEQYSGLSATNGNMLWSLNARPMPGIGVHIEDPIYFIFNDHVGLSGSWREYFMGKRRFVKNARVHAKSLYIHYRSNNGFKVKLGIEHVVQWAGKSPEVYLGTLPKNFKDYLRIIAGQGGGEDATNGEQSNALGNHQGTYELRLSQEFKNFTLEFFYSHLFDDGSGMLFNNPYDGRYGFYGDLNKEDNDLKWFGKLLYEFYYTKDQSHQFTRLIHVWDDYFNNGMYRSGWTYQNDIIGLPFFTTNYYYQDEYPIIGNSRIIAHHIGAKGALFKTYPYKLLLSYRNNNGHVASMDEYGGDYYREDDPRGRYKIPHEIWSTYLNLQVLSHPFKLNLELGGDFSSQDNNIAAGLLLNKSF